MQRKSNNEVDHIRFYEVLNLGQILRLTSHEVDHTKEYNKLKVGMRETLDDIL